MRWTLLVGMFGLGWPVAGMAADDKATELFNPKAPPLKIEITLDKENKALLDKDPRKYVRCTFKANDLTLNDVGLHLKGAAGSFRGWDDKPALTLNIDKFTKGQTFFGMDKIHLNNSVQDGSYFNEIVAADVFGRAGLPTARFTHVRVELNGRKVGMYLLKEGYDKTFLKRFFPDASGNLYDGGFLQDIDAAIKQDSGSGKDRKDLQALVAACRTPDEKKRWEAVNKLLDVEKFISLACMEVLTVDWDGYTRNRNNYRLYHDPKTDKFVFIPHGKDQLFQNAGDAIWHGWGSIVGQAVLNHPEGKKLYIARMKELMEKVFTSESINKTIDSYVPRMKEIAEKIDKNYPKEVENQANAEKQRIKDRIEFVKKELPKLK
ncbi:CotH kinase family protein [Zavarzinella formosa]|uniref:CotH kinase family protein n=1 Tax=Zavarzinella formosa TaxID=360055 RepID=UPI0003078B7E|nr:CotH kinase family protein [Zavarzinella formosa]